MVFTFCMFSSLTAENDIGGAYSVNFVTIVFSIDYYIKYCNDVTLASGCLILSATRLFGGKKNQAAKRNHTNNIKSCRNMSIKCSMELEHDRPV